MGGIHNKTTDDAPRAEVENGADTIMNWIYFILIGWWLSFVWFAIGAALCLTVIGIPIGFPMILKTPEIAFGES